MLKQAIQLNRKIRPLVDEMISKSTPKNIGVIRFYLFWRARAFRFLVRTLGLWMPDGLNVLMALALRRNDVFIDAGANVGWMTERASYCLGGSGKVYAIEPSPDSYRKLESRKRIMGLKNVRLIPNAIGEGNGTVPFYEFNENHGGASSLHKDAWPGHVPDKITNVELIPLDEIIRLNHIEKARMIKIDVQGAECSLLKSGKSFFTELSPIIYIEAEVYALKAFGYSVDEMLGIMRGYGYRFFSWRTSGLIPVESSLDLPQAGHDDLICLKHGDADHDNLLRSLVRLSSKKQAWIEKSFSS